jgi:eukaryotic-like serine/threonine-protein kinase
MSGEQWQNVKEIFDAALRRTPEERAKFLAEICGGDDDLRREVESLLASFAEADSFLETPPVADETGSNETNGLQTAGGAKLGHYEIVRRIGAGGMGEVFLAKDKKLDRNVAVKLLNDEFKKHESSLRRFVREARAASALNHPNILVIHEIGETENSHYIVSEYVEGETLRAVLQKKSLRLEEVLDISIQIAGALAAAHAARIVHRDIKPENIIVRPDNLVKILDFGLAKLVEQKLVGTEDSTLNQTAKGLILGTVNYMSPEQAKGERVDERTDIFSFGAVLYEMLAGRAPFAGGSVSETLSKLMNDEPPPLARFAPDAPPELQRIVSKTLRKNADERYQTAKGLLSDLKDLRRELEFQNKLETANPPPRAEAETKKFNAATDAPLTGEKTAASKAKNFALTFGLPILLFAAIGFGAWYFMNQSADSRQIKSIAVLPFENKNSDADTEYLSDGLAESLIYRLSQLPDLKVSPTSSVFRYKDKETDAKKIADELGVDAVMTGRMVKRGDNLFVSVNLFDARNNQSLWGEQYERKMSELLKTQREIAAEITNKLRLKLSGADEKKLAKNYTDNAEAYQLYLKGRFHLLKTTRAGFQTAIPYFQQAIDIDSSYALAYVGLADAYRSLALAGEFPPREVMPKAKAAANKALEIDAALAEAHAVLGFIIFWHDWDWNAAENQFKRALELDPNNADTLIFYAGLLSNTGRHAEALAEARRARELDPLNLRTNVLEAQYLIYAGNADEALARLQKTLELDPNYWFAHQFRATALIEKGMYAEAVAAARKSLESNFVTRTISFLAYALAKSGKRAEARAELEKLLKLSRESYVPPFNIALIYNGLGESDETLRWLERGIETRDPRMTFLKVEPKWNNLRDDARFQNLLRRMNFPP